MFSCEYTDLDVIGHTILCMCLKWKNWLKHMHTHTSWSMNHWVRGATWGDSFSVQLTSQVLCWSYSKWDQKSHREERRSQEVSACLIQTSCSCGVDSAYLMICVCVCTCSGQTSSLPTTQSKVTHRGDQQLKTKQLCKWFNMVPLLEFKMLVS